MALYQFNMARDQVLSIEKRRVWFRWVLSYLAVSVVLIAFIAYRGTVSIIDLSARSRAVDQVERRFLQQHPGVNSMEACLNKVTSEMAGITASLDAVAQFRMMGQKSAAIVLGLAESLPTGVDLGQLVLDGAEGTVKVDVYVPVAMKQDAKLTLPNVISRWETSTLLTNRVKQITSEKSSHANLEGREFLNWRFTGVLERDLK